MHSRKLNVLAHTLCPSLSLKHTLSLSLTHTHDSHTHSQARMRFACTYPHTHVTMHMLPCAPPPPMHIPPCTPTGANVVRMRLCKALLLMPEAVRRDSYCASSSFYKSCFQQVYCNETNTIACSLALNYSAHYCDNRSAAYYVRLFYFICALSHINDFACMSSHMYIIISYACYLACT